MIRFQRNTCRDRVSADAGAGLFDRSTARQVRAFHAGLRGYAPTALHYPGQFAQQLGLGAVYVKDESSRFGLNAFKGLGSTYAMARVIAQRFGLEMADLAGGRLIDPELRMQLAQLTFVTATDGNHGRGMAWAAQQSGVKARVFMPHGSEAVRVQSIRDLGAECTVTDVSYDETVRIADSFATQHDAVLMQDTAWPGYEEVPGWITQGYMTLVLEVLEALERDARPWPTHVIVQAGVGSFAAAVVGCLSRHMAASPPRFLLVEPQQADCFYASAVAADGQPHASGGLDTMMAGLACAEPSTIAWPVLAAHCEGFFSVADHVAANGMRILAAPAADKDPVIVSGESGAVGVGLLYSLMTEPGLKALAHELRLDASARVLCFSTEGATAPHVYERVVWQGWNGRGSS